VTPPFGVGLYFGPAKLLNFSTLVMDSRTYLKGLLAAQQKLSDQRWDAHGDVHALNQRAVDEAVRVLNARLETMNEFRAQIANERGEFVRQEIYTSEHKSSESKFEAAIDRLITRIAVLENYKSNIEGRFWMLGVTLVGINVTIELLFKYFGR
jgi:hypothetical protein